MLCEVNREILLQNTI